MFFVCPRWGNPLLHKVLLSLNEFAFLASLSLRTTTKLVASNEIKSIRVGRRRLICRAELDRFARQDHPTTEPQEKSAFRTKVGR
jgi:excisionase family DNA binding protein